MKSIKNTSVWIAVLTFTAVVLSVILLASHSQQAQASMLLDQGSFSMITSGNGGDESLIVIDKAAQKMIAYHMNANGTMDVIGAINFGGR